MPISFQLEIEELGTSVSALVNKPELPSYAISLAHGAGAPMTHPFMESLASALAEQGILTLRFNFPYMELGRKSPGSPKQAYAAIFSVYQFLRDEISHLPVFLGGKSYGGRMSSQLLSQDPTIKIGGAIFYGFPLHAPGRLGMERGDHLKELKVPLLFLQGSRDKLAKPDLINQVVKSIPDAKLVWFEDADHSFNVPKRTGLDRLQVIESLAAQTRKFMDSTIGD